MEVSKIMIWAPFLLAVIPGVIVLILTIWFRDMKLSIFIRVLPSVLTLIAAGILFYKGLVIIRGFEGATYGILAFFLVLFAVASLLIALKRHSPNKDIKQDLNH